VAQLLTLSKAARIVGVKRDILQVKIRQGELNTFEGLLNLDELIRLYPHTQVEDDFMLERVSNIKANAIHKLRDDVDSGNTSILSNKIQEMRQALAEERKNIQILSKLLDSIRVELNERGQIKQTELSSVIEQTLASINTQTKDVVPISYSEENNFYTNNINLKPSSRHFPIDTSDTILEAALKSGLSINYACSDGSCGKCRTKVTSGMTRQTKYHEYRLSENEKNQGTVLSCSYTALTDLELEADIATKSSDLENRKINANVKMIAHNNIATVITLKTPSNSRFRFLAGQQTKVTFPNKKSAVFPIASCPCEDRMIQIHIPSDSNQLTDDLNINDPIEIEGPYGDFLLNIDSHNPIVFIAYETGFSHIKSIIEQAIALDSTNNIYFYWISHSNSSFYFNNLCRAWMDAIDNFNYDSILIDNKTEGSEVKDSASHFYIQTALEYIDNSISHLTLYDFYLAVPNSMVDTSLQFLGARGVAKSQIMINSF